MFERNGQKLGSVLHKSTKSSKSETAKSEEPKTDSEDTKTAPVKKADTATKK